MQYRLRTLLIILAIGPMGLAGAWFAYRDHLERVERQKVIERQWVGRIPQDNSDLDVKLIAGQVGTSGNPQEGMGFQPIPEEPASMFRYKLRTLLIVLALGPMLLAGGYWLWEAYRPLTAEEVQLYIDRATSVSATSRDPGPPNQ